MSTAQRWLKGCGIGCGVALLAGLGACVVGALFLKHTFRGIEKASESYAELSGALGEVEEYVPPASGAPAVERIETFLEVREVTAEARDTVEAALDRVPPPEMSGEGPVLGKVRVGLGILGDLIDSLGSYMEARDRALLERRMGPGEYVYLYTLTYHSWLGHGPAEAPKRREQPDGVRIGLMDDDALFGEAAVRRRYRRYVLGMLRAQLASIGREAEAGDGEARRARIEVEIQRLEVDPGYVLWREGLPPDVEAALAPFRARLEATWSPETNRFELPLKEHEAPWEWK